jgi:peptidoglycan/LPS O-acetylase OafA/YrhL
MMDPAKHLSHLKYRPDIDGLRAIAILSVVAFHAFPEEMKGGFIGVDIFFVISGFLISSLIFKNLEDNSFSFIDFYTRRIKRIFPALIIVLAACYAIGWFSLLASEYKQLSKHMAGGAGFISNFLLWEEVGYFDNKAETKPLLHLWSLSIEEQFYVIWPVLIWVAWKSKISVPLITAALLFLSFYININEIHWEPIATFYSPQTRFWELLCGSLLAWIALYKSNLRASPEINVGSWFGLISHRETLKNNTFILTNAQSFLGFFILAYGFYAITKASSFPGIIVLIPVLGATLIISAGATAWPNRVVLSSRPLVFIGLISFPLYLWHWPLLSFLRIVEGETPSSNLRIAAVLLSAVLAWLTYILIEKPIRFGKNDKIKVATLISLMLIIGSIGYTTFNKDGLRFRHQLIEDAVLQSSWPKSYNHTTECAKKFGAQFRQYCTISNPSKEPEIIILGDSNANHLFAGLNSAINGKNLLMLGQGGCPPFQGLSTRLSEGELNCQRTLEPALQIIKTNPSIKTVILSMMGAAYINKTRSLHGGEIDLHSTDGEISDNKTELFTDGMRKTLKFLTENGKQVIFVVSTPRLDFDPAACFDSRPFRLTEKTIRTPCAISMDTYKQDSKEFRSAVFGVLKDFPQVQVFDTSTKLCDENLCYAMKDGKILYRDDVHLSVQGSEYLGAMLARHLLGPARE